MMKARFRAWPTLAVVAWLAGGAIAASYQSPYDIVASADGAKLYVSCHEGNAVAVLDVKSGKKVADIQGCPGAAGMALAPDGKTLYVACVNDDTVRAIDLASGKITGSVQVGYSPVAVAAAKDGKLYVCNRFSHDLSIVDAKSMKQLKRVKAIREPSAIAITPDGSTLVVANRLPMGPSTDERLAAKVSLINTQTLKSTVVKLVIGATDVRGVCVSPDGKWAYVVHTLSRYNVPTTQLDRGWMNNSAISIIDLAKGERLGSLLLDEVNQGYANPSDIIPSADGKKLYIAHFGVHAVSEIDVARLHGIFAKTPKEKRERLADDLSLLIRNDAIRRLRVMGRPDRKLMLKPHIEIIKVISGLAPNALALSQDGKTLYTANYYSDDVTAIDLAKGRPRAAMRVGPKIAPDQRRLGQMLFFDAIVCFQHWQSCGSCHPDTRADALNWDLLNDGIGNPKNTKSLILSYKTPPVMSTGVRASMEVACLAGFRYILFREPEKGETEAVIAYLKSIPPAKSPYVGPKGELAAAAKRGKQIFESPKTGCANCHPAPLYTDLRMHNVGTRGELDRKDAFDTPTLVELWATGPFLHDGSAVTLRDVLTTHNKADKHGATSHLSKKEIDDLIAFLNSL